MDSKRVKGLLVLLLCLVVASLAAGAGGAEEDDGTVRSVEKNVFVPTREWQAIPRGASVPQGLHIRLDLTTGERLGKLLDDDDRGTNSSTPSTPSSSQYSVSVVSDANGSEDPTSGVHDEKHAGRMTMQKVLENLPDTEKAKMGINLREARAKMGEEEYWAHVKSLWDERQQIIQKVYDQMVKPDELLTKLIGTLTDAEKLPMDELNYALLQLEDHLSDIDMARDFRTLGGWSPLVNLLHDRHHDSVRANAAWVIGNAVKNDPDFQLWAVEAIEGEPSALARLLIMLREGPHDERRAPDASPDERRRKAVYAITSVARNNLHVQNWLLQSKGLEALAAILSSPGSSDNLRVKVATFVHDLLMEQHDDGGRHHEVLHGAIAEAGEAWCKGLEALIKDVVGQPTELERTVEAALSLVPHCPSGAFQAVAESAHAAVEENYGGGKGGEIDPEYKEELLASLRRLGGQSQQQGSAWRLEL